MAIWKKQFSLFLSLILLLCLIPTIIAVKGETTTAPSETTSTATPTTDEPTDTTDSSDSSESTTEPTESTDTTTTTKNDFSTTTSSPTLSKSSGTSTTRTTTTREKLPTVSENGNNNNTVTAVPSPTLYTIYGEGTTSIEDGKIAVNASYDESIPALFGLTETELNAKSRFLFNSALYSSLASSERHTLMVFIGSSDAQVDNLSIQSAAKKGNILYKVSPENVKRAIFSSGLIVVSQDDSGNKRYFPAVNSALEEPIKATIPVPESMRGDGYSVVAAQIDDSGAVTLIDTSVINQVAYFNMSRFGNYVLLGVSPNSGGGGGSNVPTIAIILFVVAGILLVGAIFLIYFYYVRKPSDGGPEDPSDITAYPAHFDDSDVTEYVPTSAAPETSETPEILTTPKQLDGSDYVKADSGFHSDGYSQSPPTSSSQPAQQGSSLSEDERAKYERIIAQLQREARIAKEKENVKDVSLGDIAFDDDQDKFDL